METFPQRNLQGHPSGFTNEFHPILRSNAILYTLSSGE